MPPQGPRLNAIHRLAPRSPRCEQPQVRLLTHRCRLSSCRLSPRGLETGKWKKIQAPRSGSQARPSVTRQQRCEPRALGAPGLSPGISLVLCSRDHPGSGQGGLPGEGSA